MSGARNVRISRDEEKWEVEIRADIPADAVARYRAQALKEIGKNAEISGFRKGHIPEATLVKHFGEEAILREAAEIAVKDTLPEILAKEQVHIVEAPRVSIEPPKANTALAFTAHAPLAPEVKLPDYKALAIKMNANKKPAAVSDDEHQETLTHLRRERIRVEKIDAGMPPEKAAEEAREVTAEHLPALDDGFAKTLGYESAAIFTDKVREHLLREKELRIQSAHRAKLLESLLNASDIRFPAALLAYELDDMEARLQDDLERRGKTLDMYLSESHKTRETLRYEWKDAAGKRAQIRLMLAEIARRERIEANEDAVTREITKAHKQWPTISLATLRAHIAHAMRNESTLTWLEALH